MVQNFVYFYRISVLSYLNAILLEAKVHVCLFHFFTYLNILSLCTLLNKKCSSVVQILSISIE